MTDLVDAPDMLALPPPTEDVVVLAKNPAEVIEAQHQLLTWAESKVEQMKAKLAEAELSLQQSKKLKIRTAAWVQQVAEAKKAVTYYEKLREAIRAGYYIVPNFPVQVIALKTSAKKASVLYGRVQDPQTESPPLGEGRYVSPEPVVKWRYDAERERSVPVSATLNETFDFPFKLVKPKILSDLSEAVKLGIFDEIGVFPVVTPPKAKEDRPLPAPLPALPAGDPMVVGIIKRKVRSKVHQVSFLISWWIDTRDL